MKTPLINEKALYPHTCEYYALPTGELFTAPASLPVSGDKADEGGWSKKFWGLTEEDEEEEKNFDWE